MWTKEQVEKLNGLRDQQRLYGPGVKALVAGLAPDHPERRTVEIATDYEHEIVGDQLVTRHVATDAAVSTLTYDQALAIYAAIDAVIKVATRKNDE